jgi:spermidine/putrescine transport system substrate-binding protein
MNNQVPSVFQAALARGLVSRRTAMAGMAGLAGVAGLAACGTAGTKSTGSATTKGLVKAVTDTSDTDKVVNWSNWQTYMDVNEKNKTHPTLDAFTKQTGIKVNYTEDYIGNDEFYAKVRPLLAAGKDTGRDMWVSTDWMVARLIRLDYVQKLDLANIPNHVNVLDSLLNVPFDKGRLYSMPWQSGFVGIAWNPKSTGGKKVESVDQLFTDPVLKGKVTLLTEMVDTMGMVLLALGKDPGTCTDADFDAAIAEIKGAKDSGQIKGFTANEYTGPLGTGDTAACFAWTGDVVSLQASNPLLGYALPQKGFMLFSDNLVIPNLAKHKKNAEKVINYYYEPKVMAKVVESIHYIADVKGTQAFVTLDDPAAAKNQLIFPSPETLSRSHVFRGLTNAEETRYNRKFQTLITG